MPSQSPFGGRAIDGPAPPSARPIIDAAAIPAELRDRAQWVVWRYRVRQGKPTKVPYRSFAHDVEADATDSQTWSSFAVALASASDPARRLDGIGFVFATDDPYCGIDLDNCRDEDGSVAPWAAEILGQLPSYAESSPSGKGIKVFLRGAVPGGKGRKVGGLGLDEVGALEVYDRARYFTVTGRSIDGLRSVHDHGGTLLRLHAEWFPPKAERARADPLPTSLEDAEILAKARESKGGANFAALFGGSWEGYASKSEADLALCSALAFWTGGAVDVIERLFCQSGLCDAKWMEREDYREATIAKACDRDSFYEPSRKADVRTGPQVNGVLGRNGVNGVKGVRASAPIAGGGDHEEGDELPIPARDWPAPPGEPAWHGPAGEFARVVEPYTEADPVGVLAQFLVGFGNMIGRNAFFQINATRHYLNLFCCTAGVTAIGRKGTAWDLVRLGLAAVDPDYAMHRITSGLSSGEGMIWEVRDEVRVEEEIRQPGKPAVREVVLKDAGVSDKRLLVIETELGGTLRVLTREGNTLSSLIRQAWDSGLLRTLTKNNPNKATDAHISIIGHVTEYEVTKYLSQNEASNGFANRFLWLVVRQSKLLPDGAPIPMEALAPIINRVAEATRFAHEPMRMDRDPEAREFWHRTYADLSRAKPGLIGSITSRSIPYVMRLSCLYALLDLSHVVRLVHLRAGLALWQFCDRSASYIFGGSLGDKDADKLLAALRDHPGGLTRAEIRSNVFHRNKSSEAIAAILGRLQEAHLVASAKVPTDGRPATLWTAR